MLKKVMVGVLTTAMVATGASIAAAGSEDDGDDDGHVIHLTATTAHEALVENPPSGPSAGDRFVFREELFRDGDRVGRDAGECVLVETQGENATGDCVATLELPGPQRRLDRIAELLASCHYSFHDLSRVETAGPAPRVPRFNMPFELGLAVEHS